MQASIRERLCSNVSHVRLAREKGGRGVRRPHGQRHPRENLVDQRGWMKSHLEKKSPSTLSDQDEGNEEEEERTEGEVKTLKKKERRKHLPLVWRIEREAGWKEELRSFLLG